MTARATTAASDGLAIKALRTVAGLTIDELADLAGVSASYLSRAENGLATPTESWVKVVAIAIGEALVKAAA